MRDENGRFIKGHEPHPNWQKVWTKPRKSVMCPASKKPFTVRATLKKTYCSKKCSDQHSHIGQGRKGSESNLWRGGVTPEHKKIRKSDEYKKWRKSVYERDDYTCQDCGIRGVELNADHIKPFSLYPELRFDLNNGRTLCVPCHRKTDTFGIKLYNNNYAR